MSLFERVHMPSFAGATEWLNSEPLGPAELGGSVVLVNFWTLTCERLRVNHWALAAEWTIGAENVELDQPGFLEPGSEAYAFTFG